MEAATRQYIDNKAMTPGPEGPPGPPGQTGNAFVEAIWNYNDSVYVGPPAGGQVRFDNIDLSLATQLFIHETDRDGISRIPELDNAAQYPGAKLIVRDANGASTTFTIPTAGEDKGTWRTTPVIYVSGSKAQRNTVWITVIAPKDEYITKDTADAKYAQLASNNILTGTNTLTRELILAGNPNGVLGATPKQYVDTKISMAAPVTISTNTALPSASNTFYVYICTAALTVTLPTAVGSTSRYTLKNLSNGNVSIATTSSQQIDGAAAPKTLAKNLSSTLTSTGSNWITI